MNRILLSLAVSLVLVMPAWAEVEIYGAFGQASSEVNTKDLWKHNGQPFEFDGKSMGFRAGLGNTFDLGELGALGPVPISHGLRVELGAVSLGSPEMVQSYFNNDSSYKHGRCYRECEKLYKRRGVRESLSWRGAVW